MSYFPLDRDILSSSIWAQGTPEAIKVFLYLLLAADPRTGCVEDADPGIALRCGLSLDATTTALDWLAAPDPYSRTKDHDGRRIERLAHGGIRILNYVRRRDKDYSTPRWRRWKERQRDANAQTPANGVGNDEQEQEQEHERTEQRIPARCARGAQSARSRPLKGTGTDNGARKATNRTARPGWVSRAGDLLKARRKGTGDYGRIGKELAELVREHGETEVLARWARYLEGPSYFGPHAFAVDFGRWAADSEDTRHGLPTRGAWEKATPTDRTIAAVRRFVGKGEA